MDYKLTQSSRIDSTPFTSRNALAGVSSYTIYNKTLLPTIFNSYEEDYYHLINHVQMWDVSCQKIIEIKGTDALNFLRYVSCRNFETIDKFKCYYTPMTDFDGGLLNDTLVYSIDEETIWVSISDSDMFMWFSGLLVNTNHNVEIKNRHIYTIALQGPKSVEILEKLIPGVANLKFMTGSNFEYEGENIYVTRSGYTGEDGFEISISNTKVEKLIDYLISNEVKPIGLGARDTLRLEAGLCLYGHDLNEKINPVEANLKWAIAKKRKEVGGFNGWDKIKNLLANGSKKIRVGIRPDGKVIARENTKIFSSDNNEIGFVTSGTFGPSVNAPVAMGYVKSEFSEVGTSIQLEVRGKKYGGKISELPFYKKSYVK